MNTLQYNKVFKKQIQLDRMKLSVNTNKDYPIIQNSVDYTSEWPNLCYCYE